MATAEIQSDVTAHPSEADELFEIIDGFRTWAKPLGTREMGIANRLARYFWLALGDTPDGEVFIEVLFRLKMDGALDRRPDLAYVPYAKWPGKEFPSTDHWEVIPSFAVEVVSKTNAARDIQKKIADYLDQGVELVWVIFPEQRLVHVYRGIKNISILDIADSLDGGSVVPGFRLPVRKLFEAI